VCPGAIACTICDVAALGIGTLSLATNGVETWQDCENGHELTVNCGVDAAGDALSVADFGLDGMSLIRDAGDGVHIVDATAEAAENASMRAGAADLTSLASSIAGNVWSVWSDFWSGRTRRPAPQNPTGPMFPAPLEDAREREPGGPRSGHDRKRRKPAFRGDSAPVAASAAYPQIASAADTAKASVACERERNWPRPGNGRERKPVRLRADAWHHLRGPYRGHLGGRLSP
jgi:hypothetical protein